ncbi:DUF5677 domain-containing protein [Microbulbifer sp. JMSA008]|uniref:DUF5677 domain-containing protein n=1 Tax=Microbulbifer sp. JMSA008 TaxID=3243373 RepID=UPI004039B6D2
MKYTSKTLDEHENYLKELDAIIKYSQVIFEGCCNKDNKDAPYQSIMGLHASMIELSTAFSKLFQNKLYIATLPIARTTYEVYIDIKNLEKNPNYANYLLAERQNRKKDSIKGRSNERESKKRRGDYYKLYKPNEEFKELSVAQKFKLAEHNQNSIKIYDYFSAHTHSGVNLFMARLESGYKVNELSGESLFKSKPNYLEAEAITYLSYMLKDASIAVSKIHGPAYLKEVTDNFLEIEQHFNNIPSTTN